MPLTFKDARRLFQVTPDRRVRLDKVDAGWAGGEQFDQLTRPELKARAKQFLSDNTEALADAQERLYAADSFSVLIVLQAMDAAGKDGTIKHVMAGVNPQGCQVFAFKKPSSEELDHNFLWRYMKALPERGRIGIFNRSYYEDVLVVRVHEELIAKQRLPDGKRGKQFWSDRYEDINSFERHLVRNGTLILKFFLHVSAKEQKKRFKERLVDPEKHWKFSYADLKEREHWDEYQAAFEQMLQHTSTDWAPWWVIPADHKFVTRALVAGIVTESINGLGVKAAGGLRRTGEADRASQEGTWRGIRNRHAKRPRLYGGRLDRIRAMRLPTVLIADDHKILTEGLVSLLKGRFDVVGTVADGHALVDAADRLRPDVIITDVNMPSLSGLDALSRLKRQGINSKVIILTMHGESGVAAQAIKAGASGFLLKDSAGEELVEAIESVLNGRVYLTPAVTRDVLETLQRPDTAKIELTPRQRDVLRLIVQGHRMKEIAVTLSLSTRTVETHKYEMMRALGVQSTAELVRWAITNGLG